MKAKKAGAGKGLRSVQKRCYPVRDKSQVIGRGESFANFYTIHNLFKKMSNSNHKPVLLYKHQKKTSLPLLLKLTSILFFIFMPARKCRPFLIYSNNVLYYSKIKYNIFYRILCMSIYA